MTGPRWETPDPKGVHGSYGPKVRAWAKRELGIVFGPWQRRALDKALRYDRNGDLIHRLALLSTGRQNGKSVIVRAFYGWLLDEGHRLPAFAGWTTILAAAHDAKQARIIYKGVYGDLWGIDRLRERSSGGARKGQDVRLTEHFGITVEGLTLDTVTSQPGSARGLSAGAVAWDEMLTQRDWDMWEALSPTQSAQRSPIMLLTSTAGHADSIILRAFYDRLIRQATGAEKPDPSFYGAWWQSTDPDAGLDWTAVKEANPALGDGRLTRAAIRSEYAILPADSWRRERMNHFVDRMADSAIAPALWASCRTPHPLREATGPFALGVDVALGGGRATISVAGVRPDGRIGVEVFRDLRTTATELLTSGRIVAAVHEFTEPLAYVAYDTVISAASALERDRLETGLPYDGLKPGMVVDASMDVAEMIGSGRLAVDDPLYDAQVSNVARRDVGSEGAFRFTRGASEGPVDGFMSAVFAAHAIAYTLRKPGIF